MEVNHIDSSMMDVYAGNIIEDLDLQAKVNVVMQYIIKMHDRHLFNSVYNIKNTI